MANDYLEDIVITHLVKYLNNVPEISTGKNLELVHILPYFPLEPVVDKCIDYRAWPLIDGQLSTSSPTTVTSKSFSKAYAQFLMASTLSHDTKNNTKLRRLAKYKTTSKKNTQAATSTNGGGCFRVNDRETAPCSSVPDYEFSWVSGFPADPLSIEVDVWRKRASDPWQAPVGKSSGQRLRATLIYSDFRMVIITPKTLVNRKGWYAPDLVEGMRTGALDGITFKRRGTFSDPDCFIRAQAYLLVGRVQFHKSLNSADKHLKLSDLMLDLDQKSLNSLDVTPKTSGPLLQLSHHLHIPSSPTSMKSFSSEISSTTTSWDTGNLYDHLNAGFILCAIRNSPLLPFEAS